MGFFEKGFDAYKVEPDQGFEPLPDGTYVCMVMKSEEKSTKDNTGLQLVLELRVVDGKYAKRTLFHRINLENRNQQAVQIGQGQLSALCRATGIITPRGAHEFANKTIRVGVKVVPDTRPGGGLQNKVVKVEPMSGPAVTAPAPQPVGAAPVGAAPWAN